MQGFLISISFHVDKDIFDDVLSETREVFMKEAAASSCYAEIHLTKILIEVDPSVRSFAVQLTTPDIDAGMEWLQTAGNNFLALLQKRYGEKVMFFVTPMEIMQID